MPKKLNWDLKGAKLINWKTDRARIFGSDRSERYCVRHIRSGPGLHGTLQQFLFRVDACQNERTFEAKGVPTCQVVLIEDLKGLGDKHLYPAGLKMFGKIVRVMEDHYPEVLGTAGMCRLCSIQ